MDGEITLGTLQEKLTARITTTIFSFLNESKGLWVNINCVSISKPKIWISFFFIDITIIFIRVIFNSIIKSEGMLMLFVPCGIW